MGLSLCLIPGLPIGLTLILGGLNFMASVPGLHLCLILGNFGLGFNSSRAF